MNGAGMMMERQNLIKKNEQEIKNSRHAKFSGQQKQRKTGQPGVEKRRGEKACACGQNKKT